MTLPHPTQNKPVNAEAQRLLFEDARTYYAWQDKPVEDALLMRAYDLAKMAPTSANCQPLRIHFVKSKEAKARLKPLLDAGNVDKTISAPVTAIFAWDLKFYNELPWLLPHIDAKSWFDKDAKKAEFVAIQNATLQAAYFMLAARGLGLDCGPMGGFNREGADKEFFKDHPDWRSGFLCNLGYGTTEHMFPRSPRPEFAQFCAVI